MTGALGTYAAAFIVIGASTALGAGILAACGARQWSWTAPAIGLAAITFVAWWTVRLPGHGWTALGVLCVLSVAAAALAAGRLAGFAEAGRDAVPVLLLALVGVSIPFVVEGHFGVLGTGFNVDMSQHLLAADWLSSPTGAAPGLYEQGYPLGPHALAVATGEVSGELATSFSGVTIALPVIAALTALSGLREWPRWRATIVAGLTAFAYLAASYFAQGSFKELFEVVFLLGFALWLGGLRAAAGDRPPSWRTGLPGAILGAGALYAYSAPGLAWLGGALLLWGAIELIRRGERARAALRATLPCAAAAALALVALAAPELDRIVDFGGSVGTVSDSARTDAAPSVSLVAARGDSDPGAGLRGEGSDSRFDDDLGNLFGQISPLEALGVWPSGDFRVAPGDGAVPALAFYAGALLGAIALAIGLAAAVRRGESALLAALAAAAAIWLAARLASTPYTTAKALALVAPIATLVAARGLFGPEQGNAWPSRGGREITRSARQSSATSGGMARFSALVGIGFALAAGVSSALALANAPVGPQSYSPGVRAFSDHFAGHPTLLLARDDVIAEQHGSEFYGWELREASPACVGPESAAAPSAPAPTGLRFVLTVDGSEAQPFRGLERIDASDGVTLWRTPATPGRNVVASPSPSLADACPRLLG